MSRTHFHREIDFHFRQFRVSDKHSFLSFAAAIVAVIVVDVNYNRI